MKSDLPTSLSACERLHPGVPSAIRISHVVTSKGTHFDRIICSECKSATAKSIPRKDKKFAEARRAAPGGIGLPRRHQTHLGAARETVGASGVSDNRLTIPELEDRIAVLEGELSARRRQQPPARKEWYLCTRCGGLYQHWGGCGCAIPALVERISELEKTA